MLKNITLSAEDVLIKKAREKAQTEQRTINGLFREWLKKYINQTKTHNNFEEFMNQANYARPGKKLTREEMNAR